MAPSLTVSSVTSADGATIGYRQLVSGSSKKPGVLILHGAMEHSRSHVDLAELISPHFDVYLPDRRGRGLSGPVDTASYGVEKEVDDLVAVLGQTGARNVLGVSSGALVILRTVLEARGRALVDKAVIFEPPMLVDGVSKDQQKMLTRFEHEQATGDDVGLLVTSMLIAEMGAPLAPQDASLDT